MVNYPVRVPRATYRGADPQMRSRTADYNRDVQTVEAAVNALIESKGPGKITYDEIADKAWLPKDRVRKIMVTVGGSNAILISRGVNGIPAHFVAKFHEEEAKRQQEQQPPPR